MKLFYLKKSSLHQSIITISKNQKLFQIGLRYSKNLMVKKACKFEFAIKLSTLIDPEVAFILKKMLCKIIGFLSKI